MRERRVGVLDGDSPVIDGKRPGDEAGGSARLVGVWAEDMETGDSAPNKLDRGGGDEKDEGGFNLRRTGSLGETLQGDRASFLEGEATD
jgi:hypothetical protein